MLNRITNHESRITNLKALLCLLILASCFLLPASTPPVQAQDSTGYQVLEPIPYVTTDSQGKATAANYIQGAFKLTIAFAGVLAVVMIIFGGIQYMSTDAIGRKSEGIQRIRNAMWGLALAMGAWVIIYTVNPAIMRDGINLSINRFDGMQANRLQTGEISEEEQAIVREEVQSEKVRIGCPQCAAMFPWGTPDGDRQIIGTIEPKKPGEGCSSTVRYCYIYGSLAATLKQLTINLTEANDDVEWQVSEMFPPSRPHAHACHKYNPNSSVSARCVDVTLKESLQCENTLTCAPSRTLADAKQIKSFFDESKKLGLFPIYELTNEHRETKLREAMVQLNASGIVFKVVPGITGEHFSVYENRTVYDTKQ